MRLAKSTTLMESLSQPMRIFTVTGTSTALTAASATRAAKSGFFISAEPSPEETTFLTGQPILISTISAPASATTFAPMAIASGLDPKICIETGRSTASIRNNSWVRSFLYLMPMALTISVQTKAAPCSLASKR